jgi:uncharacterized membrane protein YsdA (DUF1294 family)
MVVPLWAWWILLGLNVGTFLIAAFDKVRAQRGGQRVRERTLLVLALVGGSVGLVLAMFLARHKVRKPRFLARLFVVLFIQLVAVFVLVYID